MNAKDWKDLLEALDPIIVKPKKKRRIKTAKNTSKLPKDDDKKVEKPRSYNG